MRKKGPPFLWFLIWNKNMDCICCLHTQLLFNKNRILFFILIYKFFTKAHLCSLCTSVIKSFHGHILFIWMDPFCVMLSSNYCLLLLTLVTLHCRIFISLLWYFACHWGVPVHTETNHLSCSPVPVYLNISLSIVRFQTASIRRSLFPKAVSQFNFETI